MNQLSPNGRRAASIKHEAKSMSYFKYFDLMVGLIAVLFSTAFVDQTHQLAVAIGLTKLPISIAYGVVLVVFSAIFSLIRKITGRSDEESSIGGRQIAFGGAVLFFGALMFIDIGLASSPVQGPDQVTSPYVSYLISVVFCMGVGYVVADLMFATLNSLRRKK